MLDCKGEPFFALCTAMELGKWMVKPVCLVFSGEWKMGTAVAKNYCLLASIPPVKSADVREESKIM